MSAAEVQQSVMEPQEDVQQSPVQQSPSRQPEDHQSAVEPCHEDKSNSAATTDRPNLVLSKATFYGKRRPTPAQSTSNTGSKLCQLKRACGETEENEELPDIRSKRRRSCRRPPRYDDF